MPDRVTSSGMRYVLQRLGLVVVFAGILFWSAGRLDWLRAWGYLLAVFLLEGGSLAVLAAVAPETLNQRGTFQPGVKAFDKGFALLWLVLSLSTPVVAGLDAVRYRWSTLPLSLFYGPA